MKHLAVVLLALASSAPAFAQSTLTSTNTPATKTASVSAATTSTATPVGSVTRQQAPKRTRRKITGSTSSENRNPQGSVLAAFFFGVGYDSETGSTAVAFGLGLGYAMFTGVVPGVRAEILYDDGFGGELAATLTLTPPLDWVVTPFVLGETGLHWEGGRRGWMYGAGGGVYLGDPSSRIALQIGYIWRKIDYTTGKDENADGPLLAVIFRF